MNNFRLFFPQLYNMSFTPHLTASGISSESGNGADELVPGTSVPISEFSLPQAVSDRIGQLILDQFATLMEGQGQHSRRKVLAGVVMTTDAAMEQMNVISVSTGTKCINGEHMSVNGNSLNGWFTADLMPPDVGNSWNSTADIPMPIASLALIGIGTAEISFSQGSEPCCKQGLMTICKVARLHELLFGLEF